MSTSSSPTRSRAHARAGLALASGGLLALAMAAPISHADAATLPSGCTQTGQTVTCTYKYTGGEQTFTVPTGITTIDSTAIGATGAPAFFTPSGAGKGAKVTGNLTVAPGQSLYLEVGGAPTTGTGCYPGDACQGGFNGGGSSRYGGGGGGATDLRTVSSAGTDSLDSRVLVAGGGGGGGTSERCQTSDSTAAGGSGGDAGTDGTGGQNCPGFAPTSTGGGAGTPTSGGAGGVSTYEGQTSTGSSGSLGTGGNGPTFIDTAGGGGGGLYGGGGGAGSLASGQAPHPTVVGASGGGGGSSLVPAGGSQTVTTDPASITISYTVPAPKLRFDAHAYGINLALGRYYRYGPTAPADLTCTTTPGSITGSARHQITTATGTRGADGTQDAHATSTLTAGQPGLTLSGTIKTVADATTTGNGTTVTATGSTTYTAAKVDGTKIPYKPAPNTVIPIHGGTLTLNEQTPIKDTAGNTIGIQVTALDLHDGALHITLGHTTADLTTAGTTCPSS
ncbi:choice-of-anchor P family protein [Leekyejoonella antrihumi]|uniref:receptor protein-tyrosine kinase n=1 Tax=Leekyejoonella antrihumi TaxID=1660198 RepID=A0A563E468_9MICO|nr:choice-of-anchor P family protein [Leekyejoonella antrihumi]TWP37001.1 hypothetical protein FGL98_08070 [Leekyejoonella antrihumi]